MPGSIKNSGTWRNVTGASVKVGGTWRTVTAGFIKVGGQWKQWFFAKITDAFNRVTSGSLGTSDSGVAWSALKGTWFANGSAAQSNDAASNYSLAAVNLGSENATVSASVTPGCGPAVWVSSAGSWYASVVNVTQNSVCTGGTYTYGCGSQTCSCGYSTSCCSPCACDDGVYPNCNCGSYSYTYDTQCPCTLQMYALGSFGCGSSSTYPCSQTGYACNDCGSSTSCCAAACSCGSNCYCSTCTGCYGYTTYTYYWLRVIQSVGGAVSTVGSDVSVSSNPAAIKMVTSGGTITSTAYSDSAMTSALATRNDTPASPTKATSHGIVKAPSDVSQGSTVDNFSASI